MTDPSGYDANAFVASVYDFITPYKNRPDVDFYVGMATESGGPVLELGCGTGRVLIPTARAGVPIVGADLSDTMLARCKAKLRAEPAAIQAIAELKRADMRDFDLGQKFALITTPFRGFQHLLTVEDQLACIERVREHLQPDGRFVLDVFNPNLRLLSEPVTDEVIHDTEFETESGQKVTRSVRFLERNLAEQVMHMELIYETEQGETSVHRFGMRYLFRYEAEHLLARCGLKVEAVYSDYDKGPFGSSYPGDLIVVARPA